MDSLLLFMLFLAGAPDRPSIDAPSGHARVQAMASARILRGEAIDFNMQTTRRGGQAIADGGQIFQIATARSTTEVKSADGGMIRLQEFY
ncbi:hypothetical protein [Sphingorhabdus sp. M41]|uniref:hypothetical protein n=1 Tax=Sphingorhabdus sp. M41 TaxID=1806885 RepID=UPI00078BEF1B|nr:hypothetical protein [Sphingorhabdus sp. M41]AMO73072.1 hypothetical protein AZE99_15510 [Sphingorhabdus sp. M41]